MTTEGPLLMGLCHKGVGWLPNAVPPWHLAALTLMLVTAGAGYRLLAEWQRRVTFDHIFANAPGGSVIVHDKSIAGPAMRIWVGHGTRSRSAVPERLVAVVFADHNAAVTGGWSAPHGR